MDDTCTITRDSDVDGIRTGTLDRATGLITGTTPPTTIYPLTGDDGHCSLRIVGPAETTREQGGASLGMDEYYLSLPLQYMIDHPGCEPEVGDVATILTSRRDPGVVGTKYIVKRRINRTMAVSRKLIVGIVESPDAEV